MRGVELRRRDAMKSLFAKIFLWFWATTIAVAIVTAIATTQFNRSFGADPLRAHFQRTQAAYAEAADSILDTGGLDGLRIWMQELQGPGGPPGHLQLLDDGGRAVFGASAVEDITAAVSARDNGVASPATLAGVFFDPVYSPDGERYWFVSDMRQHHHPGTRVGRMFGLAPRPPGIGGFRLGVALLVSGIVCYGLARYLTKPIVRLRAASAEIAGGNFAVRVDDEGRRDELGALGRDFDRMAEHLERLNASQRQLLRDVSHELRSPLARLQVAVGLARQRGGEVVEAELDRIEHEAEALEELIQQLLSVARIESSGSELLRSEISIDELIGAVARDAEFEGRDGGKRVEVKGSSNAVVLGDNAMLSSAVENVVRNALRHTPDGTAIEITANKRGDGRQVLILVCDHGPGVPEALIGELFKPFVRVDYARDREGGGSGIGLAIADAAIRRHGGAIRASNGPAGGLCVEIDLPCESRRSPG